MDFEVLLEKHKEEIIRTTQNFIRIRSVGGTPETGMPYGRGPYEALQFVLDLCKDMDFQVKDVDGYAGHAEFGEGNETVGVLVHVDVVPEGEGWNFPPFSGEHHEGKLYGRGAIDDKGPTIAALYAMKILKDAGIKLEKKLRVVFGTDEENGFDGIRYYLSKEKAFDMGFTPDARFPLICGEKGILLYKLCKRINSGSGDIKITAINGGSAPNMVPGSCKVIVSAEREITVYLQNLIESFKSKYGYDIEIEMSSEHIILCSSGRTAHASAPEEGLNAISIMMLFLKEIMTDDYDLPNIIRLYNEKIGMHHDGELLECNFSDPMSGKLTMNVGRISLLEDKLEIMLDVRYPISFKAEQVEQALEKGLGPAGFEMEQLFALEPVYFPEEHPLRQKLDKVYKSVVDEQDSEALVIGGATYARAMKNVIAFGPVFPGDTELAHKSDEYISIENLLRLTKIYAYALYELAR